MSHELDFDESGQAAMFYVKRTEKDTPWHIFGNPFEVPPATTQEALIAAKANYMVETMPLRVELPGGSISISSPFGKAVVRTDRLPQQRSILGIVGDRYTPLQNHEAFEILDPLIDSGLIELETGGVLREGADAWLLGRLIVKDAFISDIFKDEIIPYILVSNNFTGKSPVSIMYTPIRVVCANTLGMAHYGRRKSNSVILHKHTKTVRIRYIENAMRFFNQTIATYKVIAEDFEYLKARILTVQEFEKQVLDAIAPFPDEDQKETSYSEGVIARINIKRDRITQMWEKGTGLTGDHSAWEAYNAVAELVDHDEEMFKIRKSSNRIQGLIDGPLGHTKQNVLNNLVALARS